MIDNINDFFTDFAETVIIDGVSVKALQEPYYDDRDIERESLIVATNSLPITTDSSTVALDGIAYHITSLHVNREDKALTTIILGAEA